MSPLCLLRYTVLVSGHCCSATWWTHKKDDLFLQTTTNAKVLNTEVGMKRGLEVWVERRIDESHEEYLR